MARHGVNMAEVARRMGTSPAYLYEVRSGRRTGSAAFRERYERTLREVMAERPPQPQSQLPAEPLALRRVNYYLRRVKHVK